MTQPSGPDQIADSVETEAAMAPNEKIRLASYRSDSPKAALKSAPNTKPSCTLLVSQADWLSVRKKASRMAGKAAVPANQLDKAIT